MSYRVLFVCTGNICRSPTAEGAFRKAAADAGLGGRIEIDSAGTHGYHLGEAPDPRSVAAAARRGIDIAGLQARKVEKADFNRFDLILALDKDHLHHLRAMRRDEHKAEVRLLLDFHAQAHVNAHGRDVPDPYYGHELDFELVLDLVEDASVGLLAHVRTKL